MWLLAGWWLLPPLLLSFQQMRFHYMVLCLPALFLGVGALLDGIHETLRRHGTAHRAFLVVAAGGMLLVVLLETTFTLRLHATLAEQGGAPGDYGTTYREKWNVAGLILKEVPAGEYALVDYSHPTPSAETYDYLYALRGGRARRVSPGSAGAPVYVLFGPETEGRMRSNVMRDGGDVTLGAIRVQRLLPLEAEIREEGANGPAAD